MNTITIIQRPTDIRVDCPNCDCEIEISYNDFEDLMHSIYPCDWIGKKIKCPNCKKEIEIDDYEWY
ncbi:hypothetical protein FJ641_10575 [Clostridium perfringens]|nr:hypothetical protein [Clostridium perfringens]